MQTENSTASAVELKEIEVKVEPSSSSEGVIRFSSNKKPLGKTISYVIKMLRDGKPVVL
jgi:hypothetical protein